MATHLAARLVWHDRGWDGRICNAPKDNGWCIRYEWVREARDDQAEAQRCGKPVTQDVLPPCQHDTNAFASSELLNVIMKIDPGRQPSPYPQRESVIFSAE